MEFTKEQIAALEEAGRKIARNRIRACPDKFPTGLDYNLAATDDYEYVKDLLDDLGINYDEIYHSNRDDDTYDRVWNAMLRGYREVLKNIIDLNKYDYTVRFHVPPEYKGQGAEYSFGAFDAEQVLIRRYDRGDRETKYWLAQMTSEEIEEADADYWNREPDTGEQKEVDVIGGPIGPID